MQEERVERKQHKRNQSTQDDLYNRNEYCPAEEDTRKHQNIGNREIHRKNEV